MVKIVGRYNKNKCKSQVPGLKGMTGCYCTYCQWYSDQKGKWVVNRTEGRELCIIRTTYRHGFASWGWPDPDKKIILAEFNEDMNKKVWAILKKAAQKVADELNEKDKKLVDKST